MTDKMPERIWAWKPANAARGDFLATDVNAGDPKDTPYHRADTHPTPVREKVARAIAEAEGDQPWLEPKPRHFAVADAALAALEPAPAEEGYARGVRDAAEVIGRGKLYTINDRVAAILALLDNAPAPEMGDTTSDDGAKCGECGSRLPTSPGKFICGCGRTYTILNNKSGHGMFPAPNNSQTAPEMGVREDIVLALDTLIQRMEPSMHDGCACMGPRPGRILCPCEERDIALRHLKNWRRFFPAKEDT